MITKQEINAVELSPTKKDFYQMWNELMEVARNISPIYNPGATNEADPGVVLLKLLVGVADKLNGAIDMNSREAFLPSATQVESMRKLCDMMGYTMHHYRAATGEAVIGFKDSETISLDTDLKTSGIYIPRFTNLQNTDESVNYITLEGITLYSLEPSRKVSIMEGQLVECETNNDNIVTLSQLDDQHRFFFPEKNIAENGIFVLNVDDNIEDTSWRKVDNLNTVPLGNKVFKFGYDSLNDAPYIQFSDDISQLIEDGLRISYVRTSGINGNIALKTLSKLVPPSLWKTSDNEAISGLTADNFSVANNSDIVNGADPESLNDAYSNFKKTIGTFDTLVTCRDYMNKIYTLTKSETNTTPLVSNVIVSDIRDDINRSHILCSMNDYGICYINESDKLSSKDRINHFNLVLYPFKTVVGTGTRTEYDNSFKFTEENAYDIEQQIAANKTIGHKIIYPESTDIVCIKNYLQLKAKITTTKRVGKSEEKEILNRVYLNIYQNFNARKVDFGEEIPTDIIESVIRNADSRIKDVNLDEPTLAVKMVAQNGTEYWITDSDYGTAPQSAYNKIILKNILAGRVSMFKYNTDFAPSYAETSLTYKSSTSVQPPLELPIKKSGSSDLDTIKKLELKLNINTANISDPTHLLESNAITLEENEVIQFKAPNFRTTITYPAYVNYYFKTETGKSTSTKAIPATFMKLTRYMSTHSPIQEGYNAWEDFANNSGYTFDEATTLTLDEFNNIKTKYGQVFIKNDQNRYIVANTYTSETAYYVAKIAGTENEAKAFGKFNTWLTNQTYYVYSDPDHQGGSTLSMGLCRCLGTGTLNIAYVPGKLVDEDCFKYTYCNQAKTDIDFYYVQQTWTSTDEQRTHTANGLGETGSLNGVPKNGEYQLQGTDVLYINYTKTSDDDTETKTIVNKKYTANDNVVIRANFELLDSDLYHGSHSYAKKDGFDTSWGIEGMFSLGTDQQIEIREPVNVVLDEDQSKLYWFFKTDDTSKRMVYFCGHESSPFGVSGRTYTLQEEEYIFYTNAKETDYNYYGPGTTITLGANTPTIFRYTSSTEVTLEDILTYGLDAEIPWVTANLKGTNKNIIITENTFLSLTEGDKLLQLTLNDDNTLVSDDTYGYLTGDWKKVVSATYQLSGGEETPLPALQVPGIYWEAISKLDFKTGPETTQKITTVKQDSTTIKESSLVVTTETTAYTYTASDFKLTDEETDPDNASVVFRTNYNIQHSLPVVDVERLINNYEELLTTYTGDAAITDFRLKVSNITQPADGSGALINLNNFGANYTRYAFGNSEEFTLNINLPKDNFGIIAFYYNRFNDENEYTITAFDNSNNAIAVLRRYNSGDDLETAVTVDTDGLYVLELNNSPSKNIAKITISLTTTDDVVKDTLIFSDLSVVEGINPKLDYQPIENGYTSLEQLLEDIKSYDPDNKFLYNVIPNKTTAIDLNSLIDDEKMSSAEAFYDKNNLANKFVISEIDSTYLSTGITLTKSSKL